MMTATGRTEHPRDLVRQLRSWTGSCRRRGASRDAARSPRYGPTVPGARGGGRRGAARSWAGPRPQPQTWPPSRTTQGLGRHLAVKCVCVQVFSWPRRPMTTQQEEAGSKQLQSQVAGRKARAKLGSADQSKTPRGGCLVPSAERAPRCRGALCPQCLPL